MTSDELDEYIRRRVDEMPPLSPAQRIQLAVLLRPDLPVGIRPVRTKAHQESA